MSRQVEPAARLLGPVLSRTSARLGARRVHPASPQGARSGHPPFASRRSGGVMSRISRLALAPLLAVPLMTFVPAPAASAAPERTFDLQAHRGGLGLTVEST